MSQIFIQSAHLIIIVLRFRDLVNFCKIILQKGENINILYISL